MYLFIMQDCDLKDAYKYRGLSLNLLLKLPGVIPNEYILARIFFWRTSWSSSQLWGRGPPHLVSSTAKEYRIKEFKLVCGQAYKFCTTFYYQSKPCI